MKLWRKKIPQVAYRNADEETFAVGVAQMKQQMCIHQWRKYVLDRLEFIQSPPLLSRNWKDFPQVSGSGESMSCELLSKHWN